MGIIKQRQSYFSKLLFVLYGIFASFLECSLKLPILCGVSMLPLFTAIGEKSVKALIKKLAPFLSAYDITKTLFVIEIYKELDFPRVISVFIGFVAAAALAFLLLASQVLCLSLYPRISSEKQYDIIKLSLLFCLSEWLCEKAGFFSFPWLGVWAQSDGADTLMISASLLGCRFTSFIILLGNGMVYLILKSAQCQKKISYIKISAAYLSLAIAVFICGSLEISLLKEQAEDSESTNVLIVQLDSEGDEKNQLSAGEAAKKYIELIDKNKQSSTKYVFLPETAVNSVFSSNSADFVDLIKCAKRNDVTIFTGCLFEEEGSRYNSIAAISPDSKGIRIYSKSRLVPFGEYIPLTNSGLCSSCYDTEVYHLGDLTLASGICVESIYSESFRSQVQSGANLIFIPTNDSWFGSTYARYAHFLHSKIRAVENSRFVVRAGNCGISAIISPWGEETVMCNSKDAAAVSGIVSLIESKSSYTVLGDIFILAPLLLALASVAKALRNHLHHK
ncbi:MAG: apolipoprotein N-acyltransferase [Ruminococcus sp.]|nr:apolipoprotein N-acyltransferase [Ruminococcus sp.]